MYIWSGRKGWIEFFIAILFGGEESKIGSHQIHGLHTDLVG